MAHLLLAPGTPGFGDTCTRSSCPDSTRLPGGTPADRIGPLGPPTCNILRFLLLSLYNTTTTQHLEHNTIVRKQFYHRSQESNYSVALLRDFSPSLEPSKLTIRNTLRSVLWLSDPQLLFAPPQHFASLVSQILFWKPATYKTVSSSLQWFQVIMF